MKKISQYIKNELLHDFQVNNRKGLYATMQKMMAYNSNRIEGSTLTSEQTASLFDTGALVSNGVEVYHAKDIEEMTGHFRMFNYMLKHVDEPLSIELIKAYHYQLKAGVFEDMANGYPVGEFKNRTNRVSDIQTVKPSDVAGAMDELVKKYNHSLKTLQDIASFHTEYEKIHPFQDGNGRTGRMILLKQCLEDELIPVIVKDESKLLYYKALHEAQTEGKISSLITYFAQCQKEFLQEIDDFLECIPKEVERRPLDELIKEIEKPTMKEVNYDIEEEL